jgi:hypothetical protein
MRRLSIEARSMDTERLEVTEVHATKISAPARRAVALYVGGTSVAGVDLATIATPYPC